MTRLAYFRCSTADQSIDAQRHALGGDFDLEFKDEGVSGAVLAKKRPGFSELLKAVEVLRKGKRKEPLELHVYAVDRLGRDALDVQSTVRELLRLGVAVEVHGLGRIAPGVGELILAVLAQVADMERARIAERTAAGRAKARASLEETGKTHKGKASLGRPQAADPAEVAQWRKAQEASIAQTAEHFGLSPATVKRYCAAS